MNNAKCFASVKRVKKNPSVIYENLIITCRIDSVAPPQGWGGGGEGAPLYKPYMYVPPQRVGFLCRFGLKTGIDFDHFGLESGMVFEETPCERVNVFIVSIPNE